MPDTILLVEDEYAALEVMCLLLAREGYRCLQAGDGQEALEVLAVVTDYWMPRLDGLGLCLRMQEDERWRHIPVILMSASIVQGPLPRQVVASLTKPLLFTGLLDAVRKVLKPPSQ